MATRTGRSGDTEPMPPDRWPRSRSRSVGRQPSGPARPGRQARAGAGGLGPFVTFIEYERPDGLVARWDSRRQPQARRRPGRGRRRHVVGPTGPGMVDRRPLRRGLGPLRPRRRPRLRRCRRCPGRLDHLLRRVALLHLGRLPPVPGVGGRRSGRAATHGWGRVFVYRPGQIDWWASGHPTRRHGVLQRQHRHRHPGRPHRPDGPAPRLATRRPRVGLLPGGQRPGLVRGLPRLDGLVPRASRGGSPPSTWWAPSPSASPRSPPTSSRPPARSGTSSCPTSGPSSAPCASWSAPSCSCRSGRRVWSRRPRHRRRARQPRTVAPASPATTVDPADRRRLNTGTTTGPRTGAAAQPGPSGAPASRVPDGDQDVAGPHPPPGRRTRTGAVTPRPPAVRMEVPAALDDAVVGELVKQERMHGIASERTPGRAAHKGRWNSGWAARWVPELRGPNWGGHHGAGGVPAGWPSTAGGGESPWGSDPGGSVHRRRDRSRGPGRGGARAMALRVALVIGHLLSWRGVSSELAS